MKERDYARIKNEAGGCCIGKIVNINEFREPDMKYCIDIQGEDYIFVPEDMIAKSSPNIIDLIEVGDYVNGCMVINKKDDTIQIIQLIIPFDLKEKDIKSIVTKEQFEAIKYEIK